ncbi:MAG TPA: thiamine phosphate synthase [bacterium]|nr:thiamine phosphate synthase [bacterium]
MALGRCHLIVNVEGLQEGDETRVRALLAAGLPSLQVRAKGPDARRSLERWSILRDLARDAGAFFVVNGDIDAAKSLDADGIHLPAKGPTLHEARDATPHLSVGMSCHDREEVARAEGADWIFLAPVFSVPAKGQPLGLAGLAKLAAESAAPAYALGGVDKSNVAACFDAGAAGIAAIRSLWGAGGEALIRSVIAGQGMARS